MASSSQDSPELEGLLAYLKRTRGFDFTGYKRASLMRRITKRMQAVRVEDYEAYQQYLQDNAGEFDQLFDTILINVTGFFRDAEAWELLRGEVVSKLLAQKEPREPIRVWSAGCATGEEAYTLAIVLAEALGADEYRDRVKIYATDVDEAALMAARAARFAPRSVEDLPQEILEKYFERADSHVTFRKDLRRSVIFGRNDLIQDAPISRIDLLTCRNVLMYFDAATQARILSRFYFALNERGILVLGKAETMLAHTHMFAPINLKRRVFQKIGRGRARAGTLQLPNAQPVAELDGSNGELRDAALRSAIVAQIVVDRNGLLALANERAHALFRLGIADVGRPLSDLEVSYRPVELRSLIDQAYGERRIVVRSGVEWRPHGSSETRWLDVHLVPLHGEEGGFVGTSIAFADVTSHRQLQAELEQSENELQAAYEELQSTNEELETTNEELHSTVEELETTNEELQSTNEELETMNEELQSTNEELQTMNEELRQRGDELDQVNQFLEQVFTSLRHGIAVVDSDFRILVWNRKAEDLWGVRSDEARGDFLLDLDIGLPVDQLLQPIRAALTDPDGTPTDLVLPATNRRGKSIQIRVTCGPLVGPNDGQPHGVILTMEEIEVVAGVNADSVR